MGRGQRWLTVPDLTVLDGSSPRWPSATPVFTAAVAAFYAEAASVCLSRHHASPVTVRVSADASQDGEYVTDWPLPTDRVRAAWGNADDATRDGAYCVVLAAVEGHLGLVALRRALVGSGSDYYIGPIKSDANPVDELIDLERAVRLEVSGIDRAGGEARLLDRVRAKVEQARRGNSNLPAVAGVVAFDLRRVVFRNVQ